MDTVRCLCARDSLGALCAVHPRCAIHGPSPSDPIVPWRLTVADKSLLNGMRIGVGDIEDVRQADERRFNPPRPT